MLVAVSENNNIACYRDGNTAWKRGRGWRAGYLIQAYVPLESLAVNILERLTSTQAAAKYSIAKFFDCSYLFRARLSLINRAAFFGSLLLSASSNCCLSITICERIDIGTVWCFNYLARRCLYKSNSYRLWLINFATRCIEHVFVDIFADYFGSQRVHFVNGLWRKREQKLEGGKFSEFQKFRRSSQHLFKRMPLTFQKKNRSGFFFFFKKSLRFFFSKNRSDFFSSKKTFRFFFQSLNNLFKKLKK